ncbi:MAG: type II toxin-antitoxin system RelB/DinJ family antitoxin [Propionibacteriaceae bacterium]|nr:type II toxin-antitoxin system RelB/DinJ family antitoxin [Propionibacteriaceae bacterium]
MTATISVRLDDDLKKQADELFHDFGLTMSAALTMFVKQAVREQAIPFEVTRQPNATTMAAFAEAKAIARDPSVQGYATAEELFAALDS